MLEPSPQVSFAVGDRVVYPNQGVCRVFGVEAKEVSGHKLVFVSMKREEDGAVVMVPQSKVQAIGLRKVASAGEVAKVFQFLKSDGGKADLDWKQRARVNAERMARGGIVGLAEVVKDLQVLSELRQIPTKERELYDDARHLLCGEISVSLGIPECDAEDAVDIVLFPVGRERPKRTAEEFKPAAGSEEELELGEDLLALDEGGLELPHEEEPAGEGEGAAPPAAKKVALSDEEETQAKSAPLAPAEELPQKRKRAPKPEKAAPPPAKKPARPKKGKAAPAELKAPRKPARPPKAKPAARAKPKRKST